MKARCGAITLKGGECRNGLGCDKHRDHCQQRIRDRARSQIFTAPPHQGALFPRLTWAEVQTLIQQGYDEEARLSVSVADSVCGCQG